MAFADPGVDMALVASAIYLTEQDWDSIATPVVVRRNLTVTGITGDPATLDLGYVKGKVRLVSGVTLTLHNLALTGYRAGSFVLAPGLDLVLPLPAGERAVVRLEGGALVLGLCYPLATAQQAARASANTSRPLALPGTNAYVLPDPLPPGCSADEPAAPPLERCYAYAQRYVDVATVSISVGPSGGPVANGYLRRFT
ncbi:hypothetical protein GPECTOR_37g204 [Gonium pectorale]|uniref:Uncharacterized protein n=1 Tax=Gonium pectorale TaxID=33097 RepID=A0A150GBJ7_GONPE|nr:hypothetical protein GPECTOR_37g204 [Gonium pectorale]|eukprot:KXZ47198.1 hypothetical protein GPECTOR_37g204 [Gonium pectorale]